MYFLKKTILIFFICSIAGIFLFLVFDNIELPLKSYSRIDNFSQISKQIQKNNFREDFESVCSILENECRIIDRNRYDFLRQHFGESVESASSFEEYAKILNTFMGNIEEPAVKIFSEFDSMSVPVKASLDCGKVIVKNLFYPDFSYFRIGDEILEVDGEKIMQWLTDRTAVFSGSRNDKINASLASLFKKAEFDPEIRKYKIRRGDEIISFSEEIAAYRQIPPIEIIKAEEISILKLTDVSQNSLEILRDFLNESFETSALILDIRNCRSGSVENADSLISMITENGFIQAGNDMVYPNANYSGPLIALISENTSNSGTRIADCLQKYDKCILLGSKTGARVTENTASFRTDFGTVLSVGQDIPIFYERGYFEVSTGVVPHLSFQGDGKSPAEDKLLEFAIEEFRRVCFNIDILRRPVTEYGKMVTENVNSFNG